MTTRLDLTVMGCCSARERSIAEWGELLMKAGFRIVGVWTDTAVAYESVIEAEVA